MFLWRISNYATLDGVGGTLQSARWHTVGRPIVYAADHPASALLEILVNFDVSLLPDTFQLLKIEVSAAVVPVRAELKPSWISEVSVSRAIGDEWLAKHEDLLMQVPSAILPNVFNTLINPQHPDAGQLKIVDIQAVPLEARLR